MRPLKALLVLAALATVVALATPAQAILSDTTTQLTIEPLDGPLGEDPVVVPVQIVYCYTAALTTVPTAVSLSVVERPDWLSVTLSPSTVYVSVAQPHLQACSVAASRATLAADLGAAGAAKSATVRIAALASQNGDLKASAGEDELFVKLAAAEPCHHEAAAVDDSALAETAPAEAPPAEEGEVTTHTASVMPVAGRTATILALAGAAAGAVVAWRKR